MKTVLHGHRFGDRVVPEPLLTEVERAIRSTTFPGPGGSTAIKSEVLNRMRRVGWSSEVELDANSGITITSMKEYVGLCFQTGNMGRMYADLLKLQTLYLRGSIKAGIMIVPTQACAKTLGSNVANYERLTGELTIFERTVSSPLVVIGIE